LTGNNRRVRLIFREIADLLEIDGTEGYKARAYRRAAKMVDNLSEDVAEVHRRDGLQGIHGIGPKLADKIAEILDRGTCHLLERLRDRIPKGVLDLLEVEGVGPKTASVVFRELGVDSVKKLEEAAAQRRLRHLPGLGAKTEKDILKGVLRLKGRSRRVPLAVALPLAEDIQRILSQVPGVRDVVWAGSARRWRETVGDLDIVAAATRADRVLAAAADMDWVAEVLERGERQVRLRLQNGVEADVVAVAPEHFTTMLHHLTGSAEHNVQLRRRAREMGLKLSEYGLFPEDGGDPLPVEEEADIYRHLDLQYIPPELREGRAEIEAAAAGELPELVRREDIRGDLHLHTTDSDGLGSLEDMARRARRLGHSYIAVCDHTQSLTVARGLDPDRLANQRQRIARLNDETAGEVCRVLAGTEVEIKKDGSLDFPDEVLEGLDLVVASIHSGFRQSREQITDRIVRAVRHPHVDIIAHPTGRLLGSRDAYEVDMERVIEAAAESGTWLEINASPDRLDLNDEWARRAREAGVRLVINTDAHGLPGLEDMRYGVGMARRAGLEKADIANTMELEELLETLSRSRGGST